MLRPGESRHRGPPGWACETASVGLASPPTDALPQRRDPALREGTDQRAVAPRRSRRTFEAGRRTLGPCRDSRSRSRYHDHHHHHPRPLPRPRRAQRQQRGVPGHRGHRRVGSFPRCIARSRGACARGRGWGVVEVRIGAWLARSGRRGPRWRRRTSTGRARRRSRGGSHPRRAGDARLGVLGTCLASPCFDGSDGV